tara:strand:+ start:215 stop:1285 length:1071 start_codon:yes stop_codon:yes gene_type:complete
MTFDFQYANINTMTEADVREIIVRPLLHALGYSQGSTDARIETEKQLIYSKQFLGHKNPNRDPDLRGRADYICEVVSFGRWVVEVKSPRSQLSLEDSNQAHTYAAHPEVSAIFTLLTNGREFRLYNTSNPSTPILRWPIEDTKNHFYTLVNLLGPDAIKRRTTFPIDSGKPLSRGWGSSAEIVGGFLTYEKQSSTNPVIQNTESIIEGTQAAVTGKKICRGDDGRIEAEITLKAPFTEWERVNKIGGIEEFRFSTSDGFISADINSPSIFQGHIESSLPEGTQMKVSPGNIVTLPSAMTMVVGTEAIGFLENESLVGVFSNNYLVWGLDDIRHEHFTEIPPLFDLRIEGKFKIVLR